MSYREFFSTATGLKAPFDYQHRLAEGEWPDLLGVPIRLGNTASTSWCTSPGHMVWSSSTERWL